MSLNKLAIVGLDPGNYFGIAILYLDGSYKTFLLNNPKEVDIIKLIKEHAEPILISIDVDKIPDKVKKIANFFNVEIYYPNKNLSKKEKLELTKGINKSDHERFALASAKLAYNIFGKKIKKALIGFEKFKVYYIKNMIRGYFPQLPKIFEGEEYKREVKIEKKKEVKKYYNVIIINKKESKSNNYLLELLIEILKENNIPIFYFNDIDFKSWLEKHKNYIRDFPILIEKGNEDYVKPYLEELKNLNIPYLVLKENIKINYDYILINNNIKRYSKNLYYIDRESHEKIIFNLKKDKIVKELSKKFNVRLT